MPRDAGVTKAQGCIFDCYSVGMKLCETHFGLRKAQNGNIWP